MSDEHMPEDGERAPETPRERPAGVRRPHPTSGRRPPQRRPAAARRPVPGTPPRKGAPPKKGGKRRSRGCLAALVFALVVVAGVAFGVWSFLFAPTVSTAPGRPVQVEIPKGSGSSDIAELLANSGVIANPNMFRLKLRMSGKGGTLKAGVYDMTTGLSYEDVIDRLNQGPPVHYITLTIPEGYTVEQVAARIEDKTGIPSADVLKLAKGGANEFDYSFLKDVPAWSLEGYLFPKTYRVKVGSNAHDVLDLMLKQFAIETAGLDVSYASTRGMNLHNVVTIASMIEREAKLPPDRPLVSSVIYNRLSKGMLLEIDATVQYIVGNKTRLLYKDLKVDSPYNTYRYRGLPPGPIASPGLSSLEAAAHPAQTSYLFYVLTGKDGSHSFASTSAEFLKLKAEAKKGLK